MNQDLQEQLFQRKVYLTALIQKANKQIIPSAEGRIQIFQRNGHYHYMLSKKQSSTTPKRTYIPDNQLSTAKMITQSDYSKKIIEFAQKELKQINKLLEVYNPQQIKNLYTSLHPARQVLINPHDISDEEYATRWLNQSITVHNSFPINSDQYTDKGEHVRSKTEKIIADRLFHLNIPYIYEAPFFINNNPVFPDFKVLNKRTRKEFYWEHVGMIDNPEYIANNSEKIFKYEKNGLMIGKNLILTFESSKYAFPTKRIDEIVQEFLL